MSEPRKGAMIDRTPAARGKVSTKSLKLKQRTYIKKSLITGGSRFMVLTRTSMVSNSEKQLSQQMLSLVEETPILTSP